MQDADENILDILTLALQSDGFEVFPYMNCDEGLLNLINQVRPHVVVLDYKLDGNLSIKMCMEIKKKHPQLPVIALSCNNNIEELYKKYGFADYIKKPFDLDVLYEVLKKHTPTLLVQ